MLEQPPTRSHGVHRAFHVPEAKSCRPLASSRVTCSPSEAWNLVDSRRGAQVRILLGPGDKFSQSPSRKDDDGALAEHLQAGLRVAPCKVGSSRSFLLTPLHPARACLFCKLDRGIKIDQGFSQAPVGLATGATTRATG